MKFNMKKILIKILSTCFLMIMLPITAFALEGTLQITYVDGSTVTTPKFGETLKVDISGMTFDDATTVTYQWLRQNGMEIGDGHQIIAGATSQTYTIGADDMGKYMKVLVSESSVNYSISRGLNNVVEKADSATPPAPTLDSSYPVTGDTISMNTIVGHVYAGRLSHDTTTPLVFDVIGDGNTLHIRNLPNNTEYNIYTKVAETSTHKESAISLPLIVSTTGPITFLGEVTIIHDGTPQYGETLGVDLTGITSTGYGNLSYIWERNGLEINGENSETYIIGVEDMYTTITVTVTSDTLTGNLLSNNDPAVVATRLDGEVVPPTLESKKQNSITIETIASQYYEIREVGEISSLEQVLGDGTNYTFSGLKENTEYHIRAFVNGTTTHSPAASLMLIVTTDPPQKANATIPLMILLL